MSVTTLPMSRPLTLAETSQRRWLCSRLTCIGPTTRSTRARVQVANPDGLLRPGMYGTASLSTGGVREALVVPSAALCSDGDLSFVFVRADGDLFVRRAVRAGGEADGRVEVSGDVEAGQQVVADGSFLLKSEVLKEKMGAGCAH